MLGIKKVFLNHHQPSDSYRISVRMVDSFHKIGVDHTILPPYEEVDGKRKTLDEAKKDGTTENHYVIGAFSAEDLHKLGSAIWDELRNRGY